MECFNDIWVPGAMEWKHGNITMEHLDFVVLSMCKVAVNITESDHTQSFISFLIIHTFNVFNQDTT